MFKHWNKKVKSISDIYSHGPMSKMSAPDISWRDDTSLPSFGFLPRWGISVKLRHIWSTDIIKIGWGGAMRDEMSEMHLQSKPKRHIKDINWWDDESLPSLGFLPCLFNSDIDMHIEVICSHGPILWQDRIPLPTNRQDVTSADINWREMIHRRLILAFYLAQGAAGLVYNVEFAERSIN